ncbi:hypothetical protein F2P81_025107 [Scophthalmus maximus]|uniref:Uncharacterized protein n=1 Tax=Scophthalmus maximus TaxID=52904 RepID=A0A6A4RRE4_SCOMX|nr:hypothetical protein F2P81_025107 [Scophthalmus maximus]
MACELEADEDEFNVFYKEVLHVTITDNSWSIYSFSLRPTVCGRLGFLVIPGVVHRSSDAAWMNKQALKETLPGPICKCELAPAYLKNNKTNEEDVPKWEERDQMVYDLELMDVDRTKDVQTLGLRHCDAPTAETKSTPPTLCEGICKAETLWTLFLAPDLRFTSGVPQTC